MDSVGTDLLAFALSEVTVEEKSTLFADDIILNGSKEQDVKSNKNLILFVGYNLFVFSVAAVPLFVIFAAHECTSIGYFLSPNVRCGNAVEFSSISPVWSRLFLVLYYYALCKFCIFIEL